MARKLVKFDFDPLKGVRRKLSEEKQAEVLDNIAELVKESVLKSVSSGFSPVTGKEFKSLSKGYKKYKQSEGLPGKPNLEFSGDLLDSLIVERVQKSGKEVLRLTVSDEEQGKADGHNNFSGQSLLPRRPFIPDESRGENFIKEINQEISQLVSDAIDEEESQGNAED